MARNENSTDTLYVQNFCFHKNVRRSMPGLGIPEVYDIDQWHSSQWIKCSGLVFFFATFAICLHSGISSASDARATTAQMHAGDGEPEDK